MCDCFKQAGHMEASDPSKTTRQPCRLGAVHIWIASLRSQ
jgi:hypothetical protein